MGIKRKASALYEPSAPSQWPTLPSSPPSLVSTSTSSSPSSMTTEPYQTQFLPLSHTEWATSQDRKHTLDAPSWLAVRTQKRHRDNRPSEETVQNETMRKLFLAQREHLDDAADITIPQPMDAEGNLVYGAAEEGEFDGDTLVADLANLNGSLQPLEANQRSIHDFFGGRRVEMVTPLRIQEAEMAEGEGRELGDGDGDGMEIDEQPTGRMTIDDGWMQAGYRTEITTGNGADERQMSWWSPRPVRLVTDFQNSAVS